MPGGFGQGGVQPLGRADRGPAQSPRRRAGSTDSRATAPSVWSLSRKYWSTEYAYCRDPVATASRTSSRPSPFFCAVVSAQSWAVRPEKSSTYTAKSWTRRSSWRRSSAAVTCGARPASACAWSVISPFEASVTGSSACADPAPGSAVQHVASNTATRARTARAAMRGPVRLTRGVTFVSVWRYLPLRDRAGAAGPGNPRPAR